MYKRRETYLSLRKDRKTLAPRPKMVIRNDFWIRKLPTMVSHILPSPLMAILIVKM